MFLYYSSVSLIAYTSGLQTNQNLCTLNSKIKTLCTAMCKYLVISFKLPVISSAEFPNFPKISQKTA